VVSIGGVVAYVLGMLVAWYETALLIGAPPAGRMLAGIGYGSLYLVFAVAVTTAAASFARSTLGTAGVALTALLLLPVAGLIPALADWLPSALAGAPVDLLDAAGPGEYLGAAAVSVALSAVLVVAAGARLRNRQF
jgi:ABC-2 type transport system permease protein